MSILDEVLEQTPSNYHRYIRLIGVDDPIVVLENQFDELEEFIGSIETSMYASSYAPDKWTVKEVLGHLNDVERIFGYRMYRYSRNDTTELAGFDENELVANADYNNRAMDSILEELYHLRQSNLTFIKDLSEEQMDLTNGKKDDSKMTVRAMVYFLGGHVKHHLNVIESKYL